MLSSEFETYFQKIPQVLQSFDGTFSIDNFPKKLKYRHFFICNMSKSSEVGSHWITFIKSEKSKIEIFDSLGTKIDSLKPYLKFNGNPEYIFNDAPFQLSTSTTCGYFAIMFIIERCFNFDLKYKLLLAEIFSSDLEINEKTVVEFCNEL